MDNSKRNIHSSGPLGMLVKSGQIEKIDGSHQLKNHVSEQTSKSSYFKTSSGIEFSEQELIYIDPMECEPWKYANRQDDELGDIDQLIESIKNNKQLQPALVRKHPAPHGEVKYEIIFGRRRHFACLQLKIPFLAIKKNITNVQEAIVTQDAENKFRNDVSNYSNAKLYKKLLIDNVFKTEKELSKKLGLSQSSLNDLMAYAKIPDDIVKKIPNIHELSKQLAIKIVQLLNCTKENHEKISNIADKLGDTIVSPAKLEKLLTEKSHLVTDINSAKVFSAKSGKKLFTFKADHRGLPSIVIDKKIAQIVDLTEMCTYVSDFLDKKLTESGYPD